MYEHITCLHSTPVWSQKSGNVTSITFLTERTFSVASLFIGIIDSKVVLARSMRSILYQFEGEKEWIL